MPTKEMLPVTIPFDTFWTWIQNHPNCIVRAGTPEAVLYDDDDYHWHFAVEQDGTMAVQVIRGKRLSGQLVLAPSAVAYVQGSPGDAEEEYVFELFAETGGRHEAVYHFVLSHAYDPKEAGPTGRWIH